MTTEPEDVSPELQRCLKLVMAAIAEPDGEKARKLIDASGEAFVADVQARTREKFASIDTLLDEAQRAIDAAELAEAAGDKAERDRLLALSNLYVETARRGRLDLEGRK